MPIKVDACVAQHQGDRKEQQDRVALLPHPKGGGVALAVVADGMTGDKHDANQELIAQGIANMVVPFFGGIPATGAIARTAANIQNGGKTPIAGIVHAALLLVVVLVAAPLAKYSASAVISL